MTPLAISAVAAVFAWIGLVIGLVVLGVVVALFQRILQPALEIDRYAKDTLVAAQGISRNLEGLAEIERTHALATAVPGLVGAPRTQGS